MIGSVENRGNVKKRCTHCEKKKLLDQYHNDHNSADGKRSVCRECVNEYQRSHYAAGTPSAKKKNAYRREWRVRMRKEVLRHYENACACCGEDRYEFLAIDHIKKGGNRHRKEVKTTHLDYWLWMNDFPPGFRILCHNCNSAIGFYGYCPHERERGSHN
jgi:hypothetical protein